MKRSILLGLTWLAGLGVAGCGDEGTGPGPNAAPTIAFTVSKLAVPRGEPFTLTVRVEDEDEDPLTVTWKITRVQIDPAAQGTPSLNWTPLSLGVDTIWATVSDGKVSRTAMETMTVGTLWTDDILTSADWVAFNSPYIVRGGGDEAFAIASGRRLTIAPGVEVLIDQINTSVNVEGTLKINGSAASMVSIKPNLRAPRPGYWKGIRVKTEDIGSPATADFNYAVIAQADVGVQSTTKGFVFLRNCRVISSQSAGIVYESSGQCLVRDCTINDNGLEGIRIAPFASIPDSVDIVANMISFNGNSGGMGAIYLKLNDVGGTVPIRIRDNNISRNNIPGLTLEDAVYPEVRNNGIFFNEYTRDKSPKFNVFVVDGFDGLRKELNATGNFWGAVFAGSDSTVIKTAIRDGSDSPSADLKVSVTPWLNTCPVSTFPFDDEGACPAGRVEWGGGAGP